jgi:hypothetical protein
MCSKLEHSDAAVSPQPVTTLFMLLAVGPESQAQYDLHLHLNFAAAPSIAQRLSVLRISHSSLSRAAA